MLGSRKLIVDTHSEIYSMIKDHADDIFWNLKQNLKLVLLQHSVNEVIMHYYCYNFYLQNQLYMLIK